MSAVVVVRHTMGGRGGCKLAMLHKSLIWSHLKLLDTLGMLEHRFNPLKSSNITNSSVSPDVCDVAANQPPLNAGIE
jgi:hypothetical protein